MTPRFVRGTAALITVLSLAATASVASAQERTRHRDRPLTITKHAVPRTGVEVRDGGNEIVAWGGFGANGYGYGRLGPAEARRAARNEAVRLRTAGIYGYGFDGVGGTGFNEDLRGGGYNNPTYGGAYNSYVGYNGVPTALAFGPSFANRHITDSDDDDLDIPGPTPGELGYASPVSVDTDD